LINRLRQLVTNWLGFSRTEVNGFLILLPLMIFLVLSEPLFRIISDGGENDFSKEKAILDSLSASWNDNLPDTAFNIVTTSNAVSLFEFDPNYATVEDLETLGFSKHLSMRIDNYRKKGGVFRVKRDLMKIYGMDSTLYHQLYAFIQLPDQINKGYEKKFENKSNSKQVTTDVVLFDINKADTTQLKRINGIGDKLAVRIIHFRESLGGFIDKSQLTEVYGLDTIVVQRLSQACFIENSFEPKKVNLNTTDEKTLTAHPYIPKSWAKAIQAYRFQHGEFSDVRDLLKIQVIPPRQAQRIIPYLKLKD
jgi:competence protein ComEA